MIDKNKLKLYLSNNKNILLQGTHGIGKTEIIKQVFNEANLSWKYFSSSVIEPNLDFVGLPYKKIDDEGNEYLGFLQHKNLCNIEAFFFDEFNRAPKRVLNAVLELLQFKSINGVKFPKLRVVWAAINPHDEDETYSVEQLDPAIMDRFHIFIPMQAELDQEYFFEKYGEISVPFIKWWNDLPDQSKKHVSPRRLDYAIDIHNIGGDLEDVFPPDFDFQKLSYYLKQANGPSSSVYDLLNNIESFSFDEKCDFFTIETSMNLLPVVLENNQYHSLLMNFATDVIEKEVKNNNRKFIRLLKKCTSLADSPFKLDADEYFEKVWPFLSQEVRGALT